MLARRGAARSITPTMSNSSKVRSTAASAAATAEGGSASAASAAASGLIPANRATSATVACFTPSQMQLIVFAAATRVSHCLFFRNARI